MISTRDVAASVGEVFAVVAAQGLVPPGVSWSSRGAVARWDLRRHLPVAEAALQGILTAWPGGWDTGSYNCATLWELARPTAPGLILTVWAPGAAVDAARVRGLL